MKKLMAFLIIALFPFFVFAEEYVDSNIRVKLDVSDDYIVLTRNNIANNPNLSKLNLTEDQIRDIMGKSGIYFDIVKNDISYEILVVVPDVDLPINNLTGISDALLDSFKKEAANKVGASISSIYKNNYDFIVVDYYDDSMGYYIVNYYTVVNSKGYNFQIQKKTTITDEDKNNLKKIVDSVEFLDFNETKSVVNDNKPSDNLKKPFNYRIIIYGVIIGVMAGLISYFIISKKK